MRNVYYEDLDRIVDDLVGLTQRVRWAVSTATTSLLTADHQLAESVIASNGDIEQSTEEIEERAVLLLATQQPVATDLRQLVATLRMLTDLQRMGALSVHIAKVGRRRLPESAVPAELHDIIEPMASIADRMIASTEKIIADRDVRAAELLEDEDDGIDELRKELFRQILSHDWEHGVEAAIDVALLGRYYERLGDHAVSMGRRVVFLVTGELR